MSLYTRTAPKLSIDTFVTYLIVMVMMFRKRLWNMQKEKSSDFDRLWDTFLKETTNTPDQKRCYRTFLARKLYVSFFPKALQTILSNNKSPVRFSLFSATSSFFQIRILLWFKKFFLMQSPQPNLGLSLSRCLLDLRFSHNNSINRDSFSYVPPSPLLLAYLFWSHSRCPVVWTNLLAFDDYVPFTPILGTLIKYHGEPRISFVIRRSISLKNNSKLYTWL